MHSGTYDRHHADALHSFKLILIVFMFFGRVGIMTIGVGFMMGDRAKERVQYAQTKVMIG